MPKACSLDSAIMQVWIFENRIQGTDPCFVCLIVCNITFICHKTDFEQILSYPSQKYSNEVIKTRSVWKSVCNDIMQVCILAQKKANEGIK